MKIETLRRTLFDENAEAARRNRALLNERGVVAVNVLGGAGCGKTSLLEGVIPLLKNKASIAVLEGDLATTKDAARIAALEVPVIQLLTEGSCHLTATLVHEGLKRLPLDHVDLLIIENVGNPICPANFDLGEHYRVAVLSVTEGDDKPAKYPHLFAVADLVALTKADLKDATNFDEAQARADIGKLTPHAPIVLTTIKDVATLEPIAEWLQRRPPRRV